MHRNEGRLTERSGMDSGDAARVSMSEPSFPTLHTTTKPYRTIRNLNLIWVVVCLFDTPRELAIGWLFAFTATA